MCSDHNVNKTFFKAFNSFPDFFRCAETGQHFNIDAEILHSLVKTGKMLLGKDGRRHKICHLFVILHSFKRSPHCNLRFAISDVPADKSVHYLAAFHVFFGIFYRTKLVGRLLIRKKFFKLPLPRCIRTELVSFLLLSYRIKFHQFICHLPYSRLDTGFSSGPLSGSKLIKLWFLSFGIGIFLYHIQLCCQNVQITAAGILYLNVIFLDLVDLNFLNTTINSKSVIFMHYIIAYVQLRKSRNRCSLGISGFLPLFPGCTENIVLRNGNKSKIRIFISAS